jgi:hypothetical protein
MLEYNRTFFVRRLYPTRDLPLKSSSVSMNTWWWSITLAKENVEVSEMIIRHTLSLR